MISSRPVVQLSDSPAVSSATNSDDSLQPAEAGVTSTVSGALADRAGMYHLLFMCDSPVSGPG